jgi:hypothetical protein
LAEHIAQPIVHNRRGVSDVVYPTVGSRIAADGEGHDPLGDFTFLVERIGDLQEVLADEAKVRGLWQLGGRLLERFRTSGAVGEESRDITDVDAHKVIAPSELFS